MTRQKPEQFEIVDQYGGRWRYNYADGYFWQWALASGSSDIYDYSLLQVWQESDEEDCEIVAVFPKPAMVGDVRPMTSLHIHNQFGLRERIPEVRCARCGQLPEQRTHHTGKTS